MEFNTLQSVRFELREIRPSMFNRAFEDLDDAALMRMFGLPNQQALEKQRLIHQQGMEGYNRSFCYYLMALKSTNEVIGWCGYHTWATLHNRAEIGYAIYDTANHGNGYMGEVLPLVIDAGFKHLNLNRIEAFVSRENHASKRLLEKNRFSYEGCLRGHYLTGGNFEDSLLFGLLKSEWV